jgi:uncharacterized membrane protein YedE/YeeE
MAHFTPIASLIGGMLIGLSASLLLLCDGKIAGISGIVAGMLNPKKNDTWWRIVFAVGLLTGGLLLALLAPHTLAIAITRSPAALILAGLLVGFGTRLANGCTSGHGVCGLSRGSKRSLIATAAFMATGAATVYVINHLLGGSV